MRHRISRDLYAYWNALRGERPAPDRAEIDLGAIRGLLADSFVLETGADGVYPLRISGTRVDALWGRDRKGVCYTELWRPADRRNVAAGLASVVEDAAPLVAGVRVRAPGDACLELELLLLPLRHFGRSHARVMGALSPLHPADWLGQASPGPLEMISMRRIAAMTPRLPVRSSEGGRPQLLVYRGGKR
jgi:hypothetical protein